MAQDLP